MNVLLTLIQFFYIGGLSFTLPNGFPTGPNVLPNGFPKGIFNEMPNDMMMTAGLRSSLPALNTVDVNSTKAKQNNTCCFGETCYSPCPLASGGVMPMQMPFLPPAPAPVIIPARTYYEPVVHNHPPLHKIRKIIRQDRERKRKRHRYDFSSDCETDTQTDTDSDSSIDSDSAIDFYDDVINVNM